MKRINDYNNLKNEIVHWLQGYCQENNIQSLVIGVSGGIDSATTSSLCALTGLNTLLVGMPINQESNQEALSDLHMEDLSARFINVQVVKLNLTDIFNQFQNTLNDYIDKNAEPNLLALANSRSRLRMVTLYHLAQLNSAIVVGTGNKVEDYGIGFYTKYGDGGVDIAPIADLYKTEVYELGKVLQVNKKILDAPPTDGLWDDARTDEDQIGTSYELLEWVMEEGLEMPDKELSSKQKEAVAIFKKFHAQNKHKMSDIPTFTLKENQ